MMRAFISRSKDAAQSVVRAGGEHYHFNMACAEHGEAQVLAGMRRDIQAGAGCNFEDAALQAAVEFRLMRRLESGEERFKKLRARLAPPAPTSEPMPAPAWPRGA